ncbi:hypothetical protein [Xanthobacter autotrophicus]|uniref:hypothetical protein n=1 Tax=Xanthobacter autotrophicus TaxID=280 RepID=UPI003726EB74
MSEWKALFDQRRWDEIEGLWPALSPYEQRALFAALLEGVPKISVIDGMEKMERHARPKEAPSEWKGAAKILALGELQAEIEGDPAIASTSWASLREEAETYLRETIADCVAKPKAGHARGELSQEQHCRDSLELLAGIDRTTKLMYAELDALADREWLGEIIAEVAEYAFVAGRHMQEAWGKPFEGHAVRGIKTLKSAAAGGEQRKGKQAAETPLIIACMRDIIAAGHSKARAAELAYKKGLGRSAVGNSKLFYRHTKP